MELVVGRVAKAHGITGELVVDVRTDDPDERFAPGNRLRLKPARGDGGQVVVIESARPHSGRLLVRLPGFTWGLPGPNRSSMRLAPMRRMAHRRATKALVSSLEDSAKVA